MLSIISQKVAFSFIVILTITNRHLLPAWIVINTLNHFANITLSSLYLDITKDVLYADAIDSHQRRAVITVLEQVISHLYLHILVWLSDLFHSKQVLGCLTKIMAPVLPYLAEEIHATWKADGKSVFMTPWKPLVNRLVLNMLVFYSSDLNSFS